MPPPASIAVRARELFLDAVEQPSVEQRNAYLERACRGDDALRREIQRLLDAHGRLDNFMEQPAAGAPAPPRDSAAALVGTEIGPYKLREVLGEGGMGTVYVAEQERPVRRRVALKVIKPGMDTREVIARFEAERQALAMMDHPHIAKVLDAGTTGGERIQDSGFRIQGEGEPGASAPGLGRASLGAELAGKPAGTARTYPAAHAAGSPVPTLPNPESRILNPSARPYFVMELIRGIPITDYCDRHHLSIRERLGLFVKVCQAIQHAHLKGVIHRDLKPSNVLVTAIDGGPVPKVIDFGVAKALHQRLSEHTVYTRHTQMIGSPLYMSPEQAELTGQDVDTRSDVYSLGVLLYELLTGTTPFDKETFSKAGFDEMRRIIREEEPARPSQRISTLAAERSTTVSQQRGLESRRLGPLLQGELDWIVMQALEKDRTRRYESASALAADVERYLDDEPVEACPPSPLYRLRKFARRNTAALVTTGIVVVALLAGTGVSVWQAIEAISARKLASDRLVLADEMLVLADERLVLADERLNREQQARHEADEQRQLAEASFREALDAVNQMLTRVGDERLARIPGVEQVREQLLRDALKFYERFLEQRGDDPKLRFEVAQVWHKVGLTQDRLGQFTESPVALQKAVNIAEALRSEYPDDPRYLGLLAESYMKIGSGHNMSGHHRDAEEALNRGFTACLRLQQLLPLEPGQRANDLRLQHYRHWLSVVYDGTGRRPEAVTLIRDAIAGMRDVLAVFPERRGYRVYLCYFLRHLATMIAASDFEEADRLLVEAESLATSLSPSDEKDLPEDHKGSSVAALAYVLLSRAEIRNLPGQSADREKLFRRVIALLEPSPQWAVAHLALAQILATDGRDDEAEQSFGKAWDHTKRHVGEFGEPNLKVVCDGLAAVLTRQGRIDEAGALRQELRDTLERYVAGSPNDAGVCRMSAEMHAALGDLDAALREFTRYLELSDESWIRKRRANVHFKLGRFSDALADLAAAVEMNPGDTSNLTWIPPTAFAACPDESFRAGLLALADKTVERLNGSPDAYAARAALHLAMGNFAAMRRDLDAVVAAVSRSDKSATHLAQLVNNAVWSLVKISPAQGADYPRFVELGQKAVELAPDNAHIWNTLGVAQYRNGDWTAALAALEKCQELGNQKHQSWDWFFLAMAHWQLGHKDEARTWYAKAVEWMKQNEPQSEELQQFHAEAAALLGLTGNRDQEINARPDPVPLATEENAGS